MIKSGFLFSFGNQIYYRKYAVLEFNPVQFFFCHIKVSIIVAIFDLDKVLRMQLTILFKIKNSCCVGSEFLTLKLNSYLFI